MNRLVIENLNVSYHSKKEIVSVLKDFSLRLAQGELLVILGPSGCGKTTLLKTIAGIIPYDSGSMNISGIDAEKLTVKNRNLAYVSQNYVTYSFLSVYNNIALPLKAQKIPLDEIERRVSAISKKLGIDYLLSRKPKVLSGGQQQRVALAKALIKNPDIYLFDEPFSNLDPKMRVELRKLLKQIKEEYNASMIFVTHDVNDALYLADRVLIMEEGEVYHELTPRELANNAKYRFVFDYLVNEGECND